MIRNIFLLLGVFLLFSCNRSIDEKYEQEIRSLTIDIPLDSLELLIPQRHLSTYAKSVDNPKFRYVVYFDSLTCAICKLHRIGIWNSIMQHSRQIEPNVNFIFVFSPQREIASDFRKAYFLQKINIPIYLDTTTILERRIPLLSQSSVFHSFVLNDKNHIEVIGNAGNNEKVERKYYDFLRKKAESAEQNGGSIRR